MSEQVEIDLPFQTDDPLWECSPEAFPPLDDNSFHSFVPVYKPVLSEIPLTTPVDFTLEIEKRRGPKKPDKPAEPTRVPLEELWTDKLTEPEPFNLSLASRFGDKGKVPAKEDKQIGMADKWKPQPTLPVPFTFATEARARSLQSESGQHPQVQVIFSNKPYHQPNH
eukprot:TRINITY_DN3090_c0_g1_i1.p1 TRINITY_DN3090_c0_g1~~TRINITY_DN3090_c0_g1_i1.p1  ORF type:complete len:179 (-),score=46.61 TRINITY_DN3090_c0_g1_i1:226-726(-)